MKNRMQKILICLGIFFQCNSIALAGDGVGKAALEEQLRGNTVEGRLVQWDKTYKMFLSPSGWFSRVDNLGNEMSGDWYVNEDGQFCTVGKKDKCRDVEKRNDGGYDLFNRHGEKVWTIDRIVEGNAYQLKHDGL